MEQKIKQSLKSGITTGIIFGIFYSILYLVSNISVLYRQVSPGSLVLSFPEGNVIAGNSLIFSFLSYILIYFAGFLLFGILFGSLFGLLYKKIPGKNNYKKAIILFTASAFLISILSVSFSLTYFLSHFADSLVSITGSFFIYIIFGALFAYFYTRFTKTNR